MTAISPELVERMVKLVREMAGLKATCNWIDTAEKVAALLPAPVDPDLILAREIAERNGRQGFRYTNGKHDDVPAVLNALEGIKRGRYLANDGWIVWRGGECPVEGERVEYGMRNGTWPMAHEADYLEWEHAIDVSVPYSGMGDIIAYRIVKRAEGGV